MGLLPNRGSLFEKIKGIVKKGNCANNFQYRLNFSRKTLKVGYSQENNFFQPKLARETKNYSVGWTMENPTSNHVENFLNNIMVGENRHPWLLSKNKIQLQN